MALDQTLVVCGACHGWRRRGRGYLVNGRIRGCGGGGGLGEEIGGSGGDLARPRRCLWRLRQWWRAPGTEIENGGGGADRQNTRAPDGVWFGSDRRCPTSRRPESPRPPTPPGLGPD